MRRLNGLVIKRKMVPMMLWTLELSLLGKMVQSQPKDKTLMVSGRSMETLIEGPTRELYHQSVLFKFN